MSMADTLLPEWDQEMAGTRKSLERLPEDRFAWRPHPKSYSLGELASHLGNLLSWANYTLDNDHYEMVPADGEPPTSPLATSRTEALNLFDTNQASARKAVAAATDEQLMGTWSLLVKGEKQLTMPRLAVLRLFVLNHSIHHRAQLGLYLRLNDVAVPSIYGPTADEALM